MRERLQNTKAIITDLDDTLLATWLFVSAHIIRISAELAINAPSQETILGYLRLNKGFKDLFVDLFGEGWEGVLSRYREKAALDPYEAIDGAVEFIRTCFEKEIPVIIVTNRKVKIEDRLKESGFNLAWFTKIISSEHKKPDPRAYEEALKILVDRGIRSGITIIGNHLDDYEACPEDLKENFISILTGLMTKEEFLNAGVREENIMENGFTEATKILGETEVGGGIERLSRIER